MFLRLLFASLMFLSCLAFLTECPAKESSPSSTKPATANPHSKAPVTLSAQKSKRPAFPKHWGEPPAIQTRDYVPLPENYGFGSSTLRHWIQQHLAQDQAAQSNGDGSIEIRGEQQVWHNVSLTLNGPFARETDTNPNPFTDYRFEVQLTHPEGSTIVIPGYFAADGNAKNSSATSGNKWRAHFAAPQPGTWKYTVHFHQGKHAALDDSPQKKNLAPYHGKVGTIDIQPSDKTGRDFRAHGMLQYVGKRYLQFAGSKEYFLKAGADAPETLLAYQDFDGTVASNPKKCPLKTWEPHLQDWHKGDPTWNNGKGKGLIGAINYLAGKGCNAFSFLTYNAGGDGDNVWPFLSRNDKFHYDCSKLDQWATVFEHGTQKGMYLHFKMQETENDDNKRGKKQGGIKESLDGGDLGPERKLYCRELIARFGHNLALNWNLGEENTQSTQQQLEMINYIAKLDPYSHPIVLHTYPDQQNQVYDPLLGDKSQLTGLSLQNSHINNTHWQVVQWVEASEKANKPWVVAFDESGSAAHGQCPDLGYQGYDGHDSSGTMTYTEHDVRHQTLWGTLMAGGAGCEYYFGYKYVQNDLLCEDWRSRDRSWNYCRIAIGFFQNNNIPFWKMTNRDDLIGNPRHKNKGYCLALTGEEYVVYLPQQQSPTLDLSNTKGTFQLQWFNPQSGTFLQTLVPILMEGGKPQKLSSPDPKSDWVAHIKKAE